MCVAILAGDWVYGSVDIFSPNVPECSLLDRYVIQIFNDLITESCWVNKCP